jgi:hypothetical protein
LAWVFLCIWEFCCLWRVLTSIQVASTFWWRHSRLFAFCEYVPGPDKTPVEVQPEILDVSCWGSCTLFIWTGGQVSLGVVKVTRTDLKSHAFILSFLDIWIKFIGKFCSKAWTKSFGNAEIVLNKRVFWDDGDGFRASVNTIMDLPFVKIGRFLD